MKRSLKLSLYLYSYFPRMLASRWFEPSNYVYNDFQGREAVDLLKTRDILPQPKVEPPKIRLSQELYEAANCSPE